MIRELLKKNSGLLHERLSRHDRFPERSISISPDGVTRKNRHVPCLDRSSRDGRVPGNDPELAHYSAGIF